MGVPENKNEAWEESEQKAIEVIITSLKIAEELKVERAHRVGRARPPLPPPLTAMLAGKIE